MTKKQAVSLLKKIEYHKNAIGQHRDELRKILDDLESVCESCDYGIEHLEAAVETLSQFL